MKRFLHRTANSNRMYATCSNFNIKAFDPEISPSKTVSKRKISSVSPSKTRIPFFTQYENQRKANAQPKFIQNEKNIKTGLLALSKLSMNPHAKPLCMKRLSLKTLKPKT